MPNTIYAVGDELFCFWARDLKAAAAEFLESLDPDYFLYIAEQGLPHIGDPEKERRAGASMRIAFFHGSETLLLLLAAAVQAPSCPQAYLGQCQNPRLREVLHAIDTGKPLKKFNHRLADVTWHGLALEVLRHSGFSPGQIAMTAKLLERFWSDLSAKNQDALAIVEYNSLKHGFRVGHGGYQLNLTVATADDPEAPLKEMPLGNYGFGTSFSEIERIGGDEKSNRSRAARDHHVGWKIESVALSLELLRVSIQNVVAYLRFYNGAPGRFLVPSFQVADFTPPAVASESFTLHPSVAGARATTLDQLAAAAEDNRVRREARKASPPADR